MLNKIRRLQAIALSDGSSAAAGGWVSWRQLSLVVFDQSQRDSPKRSLRPIVHL